MRIPVDEAAGAVRRALAAGIPLDRAVMFHDLGRVRARLAELDAAFPPGALHAVAIKANPLVEVLKVVVAHGAGVEAASFEELELGLAAGCPPDRLVYDSPARTADELARALGLGVWVNVDGPGELERIAALGPPPGARIGLRVNPGVGAGSIAATSTVARGGRFGVAIDAVPDLVARFPFVTGLHVHTGSQGVGLALIAAAVRATADLARRLGLAWVDVGGGIPVRYTDADPEPPTYAEWGGMVADATRGLAVVTEPGRSVHAGAGFTVTRVESVKQVEGRVLAVVHVGADLFLRWVYAPQSWDHEVVLLGPDGTPRTGEPVLVDVAGPLCFAGDIPAKGRRMPAPHPGDLLLVRDTGAYTLSMWSRHCSRGLPPVWGLDGERFVPLHAGETASDVVRFWSNRPPPPEE